MRVDWREIAGRSHRLCEAVLVAGGQRQVLLPPALTRAQLVAAERDLGVTMPDGYREYLLHVSSGGFGPVLWRQLRRGPDGWGWADDSQTDLRRLREPFPHPDSYLDDWWELDNLEPKETDFPSFTEFQAAWTDWDSRCEAFQTHRIQGAVHLSTEGCGFGILLVISGPERGTLWYDRRATSDTIVALRNRDRTHASFADVYLDWLDAGERALETAITHHTQLRWSDIQAPIFEQRFGD